jgi:phenylpropionate dioxygenase-like ring-hydroxylating dioxygenase large terminal subunit
MYHGWTFNVEGCPSGIARRADLTSDEVSEADLCLAQYQVEICGKFVFAKLDQSEGTLRDFLGSYYDDLEEISAHIGNEVLSRR